MVMMVFRVKVERSYHFEINKTEKAFKENIKQEKKSMFALWLGLR